MKSYTARFLSILAALAVLSGGASAQVITEFSAGISDKADPADITAGPDGNLWFTEQDTSKIGRITPLGVVTEFSVGAPGSAHPNRIVTGPDGNLWFTGAGVVGRITPCGVVTEFSAGITESPQGITVGPDGNLWFTEPFGHRIGRITPLGDVTEFVVGTGRVLPELITNGPDGNLWFTKVDYDSGLYNPVGRITPLGVTTEFPMPEGAGGTGYITTDADGNLWLSGNATITRITPLGAVTYWLIEDAAPDSIATGADGNLWFTEYYPGLIGRVTPLGVVTEFGAGLSPGAVLGGIAQGPDGNLWFTERSLSSGGGKIGRITTGAPVVPSVPAFVSATSRKVHGSAGTFDLPLSGVMTCPTTEPRQGPAQTIVFTFDKPIVSATATITEGIATAAAPTFSGSDVIVALTGVTNKQYVTLTLTDVSSSDGETGGSASVRVGFLVGDVNQNRVVTVSDLVLVNQQIAHIVTSANFLKDVNANGNLTVSDKLIVNNNVTKALPAP